MKPSENLNPLSTNPQNGQTYSKQFVGKLPTNCLSMFGHFVNLALKWLKNIKWVKQPLSLAYRNV